MMAEMKAASTRGKKFNQKIKPYVVLQYLLKYSDENNIVTGPDIVPSWKNTALKQSAAPSTATSKKSTRSP